MQYGLQRGDVAQLGERSVRNAEVEGSNPFISTIIESQRLVCPRGRPAFLRRPGAGREAVQGRYTVKTCSISFFGPK